MSKTKEAGAEAKKPRGADYLKIVEWSEEDGCFVGSVPPIIGAACHGHDQVEVYKELCEIVEEWLGIMERDGVSMPPPTLQKEYSGKFVLRTEPDLHKALEIRAAQEGDSLNTYCVKKLASTVNLSHSNTTFPIGEHLCVFLDRNGQEMIAGKCEASRYSFGDNFFIAIGVRSLTKEQEPEVRYIRLQDGRTYEVFNLKTGLEQHRGRHYSFRVKRAVDQ